VTEISDDAKRNRAGWTKANADFTDKSARRAWAAEEITWGVFGVPEASIHTLGNVAGLTSLSWDAAPPTSPPGWRDGVRAR